MTQRRADEACREYFNALTSNGLTGKTSTVRLEGSSSGMGHTRTMPTATAGMIPAGKTVPLPKTYAVTTKGDKSVKERNVDKIKRLEKELAAEREKRHNADLEIMRMHKVVDQARKEAIEQLKEISIAADAFTIAVSRAYGEQLEAGGWELPLPAYSAKSLYADFCVSMERSEEGYTVKVQPRVGENHHGRQDSGL